ncbi:hypothetical protein HPP92_013638 [Vanilla planifolia]|uniref:Uncharacterized protein n=1 Tax=Vanilla planifolia TaxID=51239 RepID=A0A835UVD0_VANPL|nr:hypothetical protein HPP92_014075 [Vanilla planifolia]KAG0478919.1 hypothetical protein HPP92_013638 [Vanilla planifolia]
MVGSRMLEAAKQNHVVGDRLNYPSLKWSPISSDPATALFYINGLLASPRVIEGPLSSLPGCIGTPGALLTPRSSAFGALLHYRGTLTTSLLRAAPRLPAENA